MQDFSHWALDTPHALGTGPRTVWGVGCEVSLAFGHRLIATKTLACFVHDCFAFQGFRVVA